MQRFTKLRCTCITQSLKQSLSHSINRSVNTSINHSINQCRSFSSFLDSESDDIFKEIAELKKAEEEKKKKKLAAQGLTIDENGQLVPLNSSTNQPMNQTMEKPRGGPSVEAILRLRKTNQKIDPDEMAARWEKIQQYKRTKKSKDSDDQTKLT